MALKHAPLDFASGFFTVPEASTLADALRWTCNAFADTLSVHFSGTALSAVSVPLKTGDHDFRTSGGT